MPHQNKISICSITILVFPVYDCSQRLKHCHKIMLENIRIKVDTALPEHLLSSRELPNWPTLEELNQFSFSYANLQEPTSTALSIKKRLQQNHKLRNQKNWPRPLSIRKNTTHSKNFNQNPTPNPPAPLTPKSSAPSRREPEQSLDPSICRRNERRKSLGLAHRHYVRSKSRAYLMHPSRALSLAQYTRKKRALPEAKVYYAKSELQRASGVLYRTTRASQLSCTRESHCWQLALTKR